MGKSTKTSWRRRSQLPSFVGYFLLNLNITDAASDASPSRLRSRLDSGPRWLRPGHDPRRIGAVWLRGRRSPATLRRPSAGPNWREAAAGGPEERRPGGTPSIRLKPKESGINSALSFSTNKLKSLTRNRSFILSFKLFQLISELIFRSRLNKTHCHALSSLFHFFQTILITNSFFFQLITLSFSFKLTLSFLSSLKNVTL